MAITISLGAFGAHALKDRLALLENTDIFQTAVRYQAWQALGLILLGALTMAPARAKTGRVVGWLLLVGSLLFSGSLYLLALEPSAKWAGPITPLGGLLMILGWLSFACGAAGGTSAKKD